MPNLEIKNISDDDKNIKEKIINSFLYVTSNCLDKKFTKEINKIVKGPRIEVYIDKKGLIDKKDSINAFTMLGANSPEDLANMVGDIVIRSEILEFLKVIVYPIHIIYTYWLYKNKKQFNAEYIYNDDNTLTIKNVPYIPIFLTPKLVELFSDDVIIGICLHEIGHHAQYVRKAMSEMISYERSFGMLSGLTAFTAIADLMQNGIEDGDMDGFYNRFTCVYAVLIAICACIAFIANRAFDIASEYKSDDCAVRLGYGDSMIKFFEKIKLIRGTRKTNIFNTFMGICIKFIKIIFGMYGDVFPSHPSDEDRISEIEKNKLKYLNKITNNFMNLFNNFISLVQ